MFDYTRIYPTVTEPTPDARFREEYHRTVRKAEASAEEVQVAPNADLILARYMQRAVAFFRVA